jgi:glycosyltransferase involved in cell wall biosynthesis
LRYTNPDGMFLEFVMARNGSAISLSHHSPFDWPDFLAVLLGPAIGSALHLRGVPALHGGAVVTEGGALLILGGQGMGKSTLTASLVDAGAPLLCEEVAALSFDNGTVYVHPGHSRVKLSSQAAAALEGSDVELPFVFPGSRMTDERWLDAGKLKGGLHGGRAALRVVYLLAGRDPALRGPRVEPLSPAVASLALGRHFYGRQWLPKRPDEIMHLCAQIAGTVPVRQAWLPEGLGAAGDTARTLLEDALSAPAAGERHIRVLPRPFVSVVMPVYNGAAFLPEAIESILHQSSTHFEFIIVDDGSTDASRDIIFAYARRDPRIRPVCCGHRGVAGVMAMNEGVRLARGQWIARMDQDDVALPDRLALSLVWAERKCLDVCGGQVEIFGAEGPAPRFPEDCEAIRREMLFRCPILYPTAVIRAGVLKENVHIDDCVFDDYELFSRLAPRYRLGNIPQVLLRHRRHDGQASVVMKDAFHKDFQRYRFRYFYEMYPHTPLGDYIPLARVSDCLTLRTLKELERTGRWLTQLADSPDRSLRRSMARRWREACDRSAALGGNVEAVFRRYQSQILPKDTYPTPKGSDAQMGGLP